ncbi:TPA: glycosyltransferase family 2 protein [Mannheimia haemolytica]
MEAKISIITPVYNAEPYIRDCIESVLSQSYQNWELILVDDCSIDNSVKIINEYTYDNRIKLYQNRVNKGPTETRNYALDNCSGEYITFLDSDDFWSYDKLGKQVLFMQENNIEMTHGNYYFCDINGNPFKEIKTATEITYKELLKENQFKIMTVMLSRKLLGTSRFPHIKHEDFAYFLDCLKRTNKSSCYTEDTDSYCRVGKVSVSSNKIKSALWTWKIYRDHEKLGFFKSLYYFIHYAYNGFMKHKKS